MGKSDILPKVTEVVISASAIISYLSNPGKGTSFPTKSSRVEEMLTM